MLSTLILVHGGALSSRMFTTLTPELENRGYTKIITPDLPGHGTNQGLGSFSFAKSTELIHKTIQDLRSSDSATRILLVGISLGGQAVLDLLAHHPADVDLAIVSGASIAPPSDDAPWEMPRMPEGEEGKFWMDLIMKDVEIVGMDEAQKIQQASFAFKFEPDTAAAKDVFPPVMVLIGEKDVAMARRDQTAVLEIVKRLNGRSEGIIFKDAWHNHSMDRPERFADLIAEWDRKMNGNASSNK
ncbi:hypothetical protein yc1106_07827 [Curvularia clavata]|uniref:AB hydrolase-1 domain-containing protein n=1 Tax=Curvularia clavata TaxID=95742 RepID=A0A9Q8ZI52_CURCL|nr:hypothetical protein yc1106_07827 [Curvularia clavata]